ncbi:MAG: HPF/RaiA family ribosome-associated protein [Longimicrobiales bacterium]
MHIQITARGVEVSDQLRERAEELAERWVRYEPLASAARLVFEAQGQSHTVEALISRDRLDPVACKGEGPDFRTALDELGERASKILRRDHQKRTKRQHSPADPLG